MYMKYLQVYNILNKKIIKKCNALSLVNSFFAYVGKQMYFVVAVAVNLGVATQIILNISCRRLTKTGHDPQKGPQSGPRAVDDVIMVIMQAVQGTGLAFIAFTEAMTHFPASPFWSVMFFFMLINLGLGSMIGTMTGITTPVLDTYKVQKELFTGEKVIQCCLKIQGTRL